MYNLIETMKYLFIIPNYHMKADSAALVSREYVNYLANKKDDVTVISFDNFHLSRELITKEDNVKVINLLDERSLKSKDKSYFELNKVKKMMIKLSCHFKRIGKIKTNEWPLDAVSYKKITKCLDKDYDILISESSPFYSHVLGSYLLKKGYVKKWYPILWDPYVYNATMPNRLCSRKKAAIKVLEKANRVYCSDGVISGNISNGFKPDYLSKSVTIKYPGLKEFPVIKKVKSDNKSLLYIGTFYEDIRNPKEMFKVLDNLPSEYKVKLYSKGCEEIVNKLSNRYELCEQVNKDKVPELILSSGIVINLSNLVTNQIPAKTFELISSGKPIINFYFSKEDPSLKYFKKRPLCFNLNLNDYSKDDVDRLIKFVKDNSDKSISFLEAIKDLKEYEHKEALTSFFDEITK